MADDTTTSQCPNCSGDIAPETFTCRNCGLNVQTGESFDMQIRKAKGARDKPRPMTSRLGVGMLLALGFIVLAGFMYQRNMVDVIREDRYDFYYYIADLQRIDSLVIEGNTDEAERIAIALIEDLEAERDALDEEHDKAKISMLSNLIAKTDYWLDQTGK